MVASLNLSTEFMLQNRFIGRSHSWGKQRTKLANIAATSSLPPSPPAGHIWQLPGLPDEQDLGPDGGGELELWLWSSPIPKHLHQHLPLHPMDQETYRRHEVCQYGCPFLLEPIHPHWLHSAGFLGLPVALVSRVSATVIPRGYPSLLSTGPSEVDTRG